MPRGIYKHKSKWNKILTKKFLIQEYLKKEKYPYKIAKEVGCSFVTIYNYLRIYKLPIRTTSESHKGKNNGEYINGRTLKKYYCIDCGDEITFRTTLYGEGRCCSCSNKKSGLLRWQNEEYRKKQLEASFEGRQIKPNKPEKLLNKLFRQILTKEYKYVGNGKVILGGFCPDFVNVNGQKKIIELYGDYWHNLESWKLRDKRRLKTYAKCGYKTLIIWEHELKDLELLISKIMEFNLKELK